MIRVVCQNCGSKLNAKAKLAGQTRKCPKCGEPVLIPAEAGEGKTSTEAGLQEAEPGMEGQGGTAQETSSVPIIYANPATEALPSKNLLKRLHRTHRYLICDQSNVRAAWANDGRGWMLKVSSGFAPAKQNREVLPAYGTFTLVELVMKHTDDGLRLEALEIYKLASRFAMPKLERGDDDICEAIVDRCPLTREQKASIYQIFKTLFMRDVWGDSTEVINFLLNADTHSHTSRGTNEEEKES